MEDEFRMVSDRVDSHVTEIQLFKADGSPYGVARVWPKAGKFGWAHPNGTEGIAENFEQATEAINAETGHAKAP